MKFKHPPINELAIGVYFDGPISGLRAEHIGLFWHQIRDKFPKVNQAAPIVAGSAAQAVLAPAADEFYPLPRFWFVASDESMLVQLQRNAFLLNWRKREEVYPHYETVKNEFDRIYDIFAEFINRTVRGKFAIEAAELTYTNLAREGEYWSGINDIARIIPSFRPVEIGIDGATLTSVNHTSVWQAAENLSITAKVQTGTLTAEKRAALIFELSAKGRLRAATKAEADAWFDQAHAFTGKAFRGMTNPDIQRDIWQPESGAA